MNFINKLLLRTKIPPTRGTRYKNSYHELMLKNSIRVPNPGFGKEIPTFQTFTVIWSDNMKSFTLKSMKDNKFRLK